MNDYTYEYYIVLDDGCFITKDGTAVAPDVWQEVYENNRKTDLRAFFPSRSLASLAGQGFVMQAMKETGIKDVTFQVESIVRYK